MKEQTCDFYVEVVAESYTKKVLSFINDYCE